MSAYSFDAVAAVLLIPIGSAALLASLPGYLLTARQSDPRRGHEVQQQGERAEARHHQIDIAGPGITRFTMMRHHQCPGSQRHEFPGEQVGKRVVRQHHEIHASQKGREKWQHAVRRRLVVTVAESVEACGCPAEIDDDEKERRQRVEVEMGAEPGQTYRQRQIAA
jgi:hypothetical protein